MRKKNLTVRMDEDKIWELKEKATKARMSLGEYLANAGTVGFEQVMTTKEKQNTNNSGGVPAQ